MKAFLKNMVLLLGLVFFYCSYSKAQDVLTTNNLLNPTGWQGCLTQYNGFIWGGTSGGPCPVQRSGDGAILFSYGQSTLSQTIAVNQALSGTGIQVRGYEYSWTLKNANAGSGQNPSYDPLTIDVSLTDNTGKQIEYKRYDYSYRINDWTNYTGKETYKNPYSLSGLGNLGIAVTSKDAGYWAGYYGPEMNYLSVRLNYSVDPCLANPLSSTNCPGYQQAYLEQQCSLNPLYNTSCAGYQQAYFTQQCTMNPLYNPACPGYQQAYFTQQCTSNPLSNVQCPGYAAAYFNQQCSLNPFYNITCPQYQSAYFDQQCKLNSLYSTQCPGYNEAYRQKLFTDSCTANPQSNVNCPGYKTTTTLTPTTTTTTAAVSADVPLVSDPIVNQTITPKKEEPGQIIPGAPASSTSSASPTNSVIPLGQGLQPSRTVSRNSSPTTTSRAREVAANAERSAQQTAQKSADEAKQDAQMAAMSTIPGFSAYQSAMIPDVPFYRQEQIYTRVTMSDNQRAQRALNQRSDIIHQRMVDQQYNLVR